MKEILGAKIYIVPINHLAVPGDKPIEQNSVHTIFERDGYYIINNMCRILIGKSSGMKGIYMDGKWKNGSNLVFLDFEKLIIHIQNNRKNRLKKIGSEITSLELEKEILMKVIKETEFRKE